MKTKLYGYPLITYLGVVLALLEIPVAQAQNLLVNSELDMIEEPTTSRPDLLVETDADTVVNSVQPLPIRKKDFVPLKTTSQDLTPLDNTNNIQAEFFENLVGQETNVEVSVDREPVPWEERKGWRFSFQPYFLIPFQIDAEVSTDISIPVDVEIPVRVKAEIPVNIGVNETINLFDISFESPLGLIKIAEGDLILQLNRQVENNFVIEGETTVPISTTIEKSINVPIDLSLGDVLKFDDIFTFSGLFEAWNGNFGLMLGGYYALLGEQKDIDIGPITLGPTTIGPVELGEGRPINAGPVTGNVGPIIGEATVGPITIEELETSVDASFSVGYVDLAAAYHIGNNRVQFEPLAGMRINIANVDISFDPGPDLKSNSVFLEPLVGGRLSLNLLPNLDLGVRGDVSGFGVGTDLSWNLAAGLKWQIARSWTLLIGYQIYSLDFSKDQGDDNLGLDFQEQSIHLGFRYRF